MSSNSNSAPIETASHLIIPNDILRDKKLSSSCKLILSIIIVKKTCTARELSNLTGHEIPNIYTSIKKLKKRGVAFNSDGNKFSIKNIKMNKQITQ